MDDVDCEMEYWSDWSACSEQCAGGTQYRIRAIAHYPQNDGNSCGETDEIRDCNTQACGKSLFFFLPVLFYSTSRG